MLVKKRDKTTTSFFITEIRLRQNLANVDLVIYGLFVTKNFKAAVPNPT